jgi:CheY-like chemotaxis protein
MSKILIVDDDPDTCNTLRQLLTRAGWEVLCVSQSSEAFKRLSEVEAQVVLLDVVMPEVDGFGVLAQIRSDPKTARTTVVMYSALADEETRQRAQLAGANDYLDKAVPFGLIRERLSRYAESTA